MTKTGEMHLSALRDGREVFLKGQRVEDVTSHPAFRNSVRTAALGGRCPFAGLFTRSADPHSSSLPARCLLSGVASVGSRTRTAREIAAVEARTDGMQAGEDRVGFGHRGLKRYTFFQAGQR